MSATFAGWLAASTRREFVLCELEPSISLMGFTAVGGLYTSTYQIACPRFAQTDVFQGGLYRPVVSVSVDDQALTARASVALVNANAGSYWWDEANELLYVHTGSAADPDTFTVVQAMVRLYFSNAPLVLEQTPGTPATAVYYHPWLTNDLPKIHRQVEDLLYGSMTVPSGSVSFTNGHGAWWTMVAADGAWNWKYKVARFYIGGSYDGMSLTRDQYAAMATMRIEDVAPNEQICAIPLQPLQRFAEIELPVTPFFESDYANLGDGVMGTKKWIGYGRTTMKPDLTDTTGYGVYTCADAAYQTLFAVNAAYAIRKDTGVWTLLTPATDYTVDLTACTVTVVHASYPHQDYQIAVDVTGKPDGLGGYINTFAAIVRDLLTTFLGVSSNDIDTAAFDVVALEADAELSFWVKSQRALTSLLATSEAAFPSLGRSVMGAIQQTIEGQWTARIWNPDVDAIDTSLSRRDLAVFVPKPKLKTTFSTIRVHYNFDHAREEWSIYEADSPATRYRTGSHDRLDIYTFLRTESNARTIAQRYLMLAGAVTVEATFEERGSLLARHEAGGKALVTFAPAPTIAGAYANQPFEVMQMDVVLAPKLRVTGVLGDLRGLGGRIGRWMDSSAPDWSTATEAERMASGFWSDSAGLIDPGDPASMNRSLWW